MKRLSLCLVAAVLLIGLFAAEGMAKDAYKIGVMTGTVSQSEDEYRAAEMLRSKYGEMISTLPILTISCRNRKQL